MSDSQSLFDTLSGSFGHGVDRPALNAFVANSQARNALVSAQTDEAMNNAQKQQEEMQAHAALESSLQGVLGDDGKPLLTPSAARNVANELKGHFGNAQQVMAAHREMQQAHNTGIVSNPANLNTPEGTAALAGLTNKAPEAVAVSKEYSVPAGMAPPDVKQTPLGAAETASYGATAGLHQAQAKSGGFNPHAGAMAADLSDDAAYNAAVKYNQFGTMPPMGMGGGGGRAKILQFAASLSHDPNWQPTSWNAQGASPSPTPGAPGVGAPGPTTAVPPGHPSLSDATNAASNPSDMKAQGSALADMTKRTSVADSSEQTALKNLQVAREALAQADQMGSPLANTIVNKVRSGMFGDPQVSAYQNAISTARNEYARVISMATGAQGITDHAMREGQKLFPDDLAPAQFESNFAVAQREMANRTGAMHEQISSLKKGIHTPAGQTSVPAPSAGPSPSAAPAAAPMSLDDYLKARGH
jgi:hypothetical protein